MTGLSRSNSEYISKGVAVSPAVPSVGDTLKVTYDGILSKSGATHMYAHIGYGSKWDKVEDYKMTKGTNGFEADIRVSYGDTLNMCFKDCANNWDNNSGKNYSFDVSM